MKFEKGDIICYNCGGRESLKIVLILDIIDGKYIYHDISDIDNFSITSLVAKEMVLFDYENHDKTDVVVSELTDDEASLWYKLSNIGVMTNFMLKVDNILRKTIRFDD